MAGLGVYKLDNGESFPTNCFPIRSSHQNKEGAGHWLTVHRGSVEDRCKSLKHPTSLKRVCTGPSGQSECERPRQKASSKSSGNVLNGTVLLALHSVDKPSDLCYVDISERKLKSVTLDGLEEFDSAAYINASDNYLTLEAFSRFPALKELELSLNCISTVKVNAVDFPKLEVLDLSYNNLSSDSILAIGLLQRLKVLYLTGNGLQTLPPDMTVPNILHGDQGPVCSTLFQTLEVLMLDDNNLSSCVFRSLSNLKRLRHLNLEGNYISEVPYLQVVPVRLVPGCSDSQVNQQKRSSIGTDIESPQLMDEGDLCPPLPELRYLNLANNKIFEEEALLAVALLPFLSELVIHSNPLTTQRSGDPPMLTWILQDRLGIKIRRKKILKTDIDKPRLVLPLNPKRKKLRSDIKSILKEHNSKMTEVETKLPKLQKVSLITKPLCASELASTNRSIKQNNRPQPDFKCTDMLFPSSSETNTADMKKEKVVTASSGSDPLEMEKIEIHSKSHRNEEMFFVTEVNYLHKHDYQDKTEKTADITDFERNDTKHYLFGYEVLEDNNLDVNMTKSIGIQQTVRALEFTLKNLLVYRDFKVNSDCLQRLYKEQPKGTRKLLSAKPQKTKGEKVKEILTEMKERKTISEVPLENILPAKKISRNEYEKARILLKDIKSKYKMVHSKSMEQAAQLECNCG